MSMDPSDYDLGELQGVPEGGSIPIDGNDAGGESPADDVMRSNQYRELMLLEGAADDLEKPYLEELPSSYGAEMVIFEWLEFLMAKVGYKGTLETLRYYRSIDWVTADIEDRLGEYLRSFETADSGGAGDLDRSDHVLSLVYVARLASMAD